jgi:hypothetical protein
MKNEHFCCENLAVFGTKNAIKSCVKSLEPRSEGVMNPNGKTRWEELATKASKETDNEKLVKIVEELCRAIDEDIQQTPRRSEEINRLPNESNRDLSTKLRRPLDDPSRR